MYSTSMHYARLIRRAFRGRSLEMLSSQAIQVNRSMRTYLTITLAFIITIKGSCSWGAGPPTIFEDGIGIRCVRTIKAHKECMGDLSFSPDGRMIVSTGDEKLVVWEVASGKKIREKSWKFASGINALYSQNGKALIRCVERDIQILDTETLRERRKFSGPPAHAMKLLCASWDRRWLLLRIDKKIIVVDSESLEAKWSRQDTEKEPYVRTAAYSPTGKLLALAVDDYEEIRLCEAGSGKEIRRLSNRKAESRGSVCSLVFAPQEQFVAGVSFSYNGILRWDTQTGEQLPPLSWLSPSMDGKGPPGKVRSESEPGALSLAQSPDGRMMAIACRDGWMRLLEVASGRVRYEAPCAAIKVTFSRDGRSLSALGFPEGDIWIWDLRHRRSKDATKLSERSLEQVWRDLADNDAVIGFQAVQSLIARPDQAVALLRRVQPVTAITKEGIGKLVIQLDDESFEVREAASRRFDELGLVAETTLEKALRDSPSSEMSARLKRFLQQRHTRSGRNLQNARAVEVLECIGSPKARFILEELAKGCEGAPLTIDSQGSLGRLRGSYRSSP